MTAGIQLTHVSATYHGQCALSDISFTLPKGQMIGIIGPNGAGKSTLMKSLLDLKTHTGRVTFDDKPLAAIQHQVAYVEQRASLDVYFPITVFETVLMGTYPALGLLKRPGAKERAAATEALDRVGLSAYANSPIHELSGGQLQRVLIARVIAQNAEWIFLDEPFVGIDVVSERLIVHLLKTLASEGKTILIVHHDLNKVPQYFTSLVILRTHLVACGPVPDVFCPNILKKAYDSPFLASFAEGDSGAFHNH